MKGEKSSMISWDTEESDLPDKNLIIQLPFDEFVTNTIVTRLRAFGI